jgi:hypothetical protein
VTSYQGTAGHDKTGRDKTGQSTADQGTVAGQTGRVS